jgi:hypothetical protein
MPRVDTIPHKSQPSSQKTNISPNQQTAQSIMSTATTVLHAAITQQSQENIMLTSPTASATPPLLAPETTTGVYRSVVVPSPTCVEKHQHQPDTHIPRDTQQPPENKQKESPGHCRSFPSRILRLHSTVHKSEAAHITLEFHNPTQNSNMAT